VFGGFGDAGFGVVWKVVVSGGVIEVSMWDELLFEVNLKPRYPCSLSFVDKSQVCLRWAVPSHVCR
jgi:hypothetical protein